MRFIVTFIVLFGLIDTCYGGGIQFANDNFTSYPTYASGIYGPVSYDHKDASGQLTYYTPTYSLTASLLIVDCVMWTCGPSGGRRLNHGTPPAKDPISYPDSTLTATDPCDMTTVVTPAVAAGKVAGFYWPWMSQCVMKGLTVAPLTKFKEVGFAAILAIQQSFDAWNWGGVGSNFFSAMKFDNAKVNNIPDLPFFFSSICLRRTIRDCAARVQLSRWCQALTGGLRRKSQKPKYIAKALLHISLFLS